MPANEGIDMSDDFTWNTSGTDGEPSTELSAPEPARAPAVPAWLKWYVGTSILLIVLLGNSLTNLNAKVADLASVSPAEQSLYEQPKELGRLIARVKKSVVQVFCKDWYGTGWAIDLEPPTDAKELALFKKFPYSVLTNEHVVDDCLDDPTAVSIEVNGVETDAYLDNWDVKRDLALLMVKPKLPGLEVGARPMPGSWVMTVGNPFELEQAVSIGNVLNIDGIDLVNSAPINHGNSGGPLVNARGRVVGITTRVRIAPEDDPTDAAQDWNVATTIPALCKEIIECAGDPQWTWK